MSETINSKLLINSKNTISYLYTPESIKLMVLMSALQQFHQVAFRSTQWTVGSKALK